MSRISVSVSGPHTKWKLEFEAPVNELSCEWCPARLSLLSVTRWNGEVIPDRLVCGVTRREIPHRGSRVAGEMVSVTLPDWCPAKLVESK
jgi:hypothetical protein